MTYVYFDGASSPHKKNGAGWAVVVVGVRDGIPVRQVYSGALPPDTSNNVAEMFALHRAVMLARGIEGEVEIKGDSTVAIGWLLGRTRCRVPEAKEYRDRAQKHYRWVDDRCRVVHIRRDLNEADGPAKEAKKEKWSE